ncbi:MAG TPA: hypothetical protein VND64_12920, partial [Pirellulales bacterium]|nr:hypothetical protein [Pirellulales bacterium]
DGLGWALASAVVRTVLPARPSAVGPQIRQKSPTKKREEPIFEWCDSPYAPYSNVGEMAVDDVASLEVLADDDNARVLRGGTFNADPQVTRSANRAWHDPSCPDGSHIYGFRVARTYP